MNFDKVVLIALYLVRCAEKKVHHASSIFKLQNGKYAVF